VSLLDRLGRPKSNIPKEASMSVCYYIGLDIHKKTISYCIKKVDGTIFQQGKIAAERKSLSMWVEALPVPWCGAMEATIFTGWVYVPLALLG
jgi:hypothetical protein